MDVRPEAKEEMGWEFGLPVRSGIVERDLGELMESVLDLR